MTVYMVVTADEYELPVMVSSSVKPIAEMFNTKTGIIHNTINQKRVRNHKYRIVKVNLEDTDE